MMEPSWLDKTVILGIQKKLLHLFGGLEGLRDEGLLESAMNRPRDLFYYGDPSLYELAAAYAEGIVKNHPFLDGNKRAGFMAAYTFLGINGLSLEATEAEAVVMTVGLAAGELRAEGYAMWLKDNCRRR
jgi:death-on-curing protein